MRIFITGGTGYLGQRLIPALVGRGHAVTALVRAGSEQKLPAGCRAVTGDALKAETYRGFVPGHDTFVHLIGVAHPNPSKAAEFRAVDLVSAEAAVTAAKAAGIGHFIYLSVAQPAPVMQAYNAVRAQGEAMIRAAGLHATFLRPLYVLGPGHWWPYAILPVFWICALWPGTRAGARRLQPVTLQQMISALVWAVETPATGARVLEAPQIRICQANS